MAASAANLQRHFPRWLNKLIANGMPVPARAEAADPHSFHYRNIYHIATELAIHSDGRLVRDAAHSFSLRSL
jgi:hypothetical protein